MPRLHCLAALLAAGLAGSAPPPGPGPRFTPDGALVRPDGVERWVLVGSSLGLGYSDPTGEGSRMFHHVYLAPAAYDAVRRTGRFPSGTMLALVLAPAAARVAPARQGVFADGAVRMEVAVKDRCERCHAEHGARDHVFTQFYPLLRAR